MRIRLLIVASLLVGGCSTAPQVREYIDNDTAATISVTDAGWIFSRERPDLAVHAQDYITVTPLQVNRTGKRVVYLYCQLWSTIDRRRTTVIIPAQSELALLADDRRVPLPRSPTDIRPLGLGHAPVAAPNNEAEVRVVPIDMDVLRSIANADEVRVALSMNGITEYFVSWREGRAAFMEFVRRMEVGP